MNKSIIKALNLTEEQIEKFKHLERQEETLKEALEAARVHKSAAARILAAADLTKIEPASVGILTEQIREKWADFIIDKE